MGSTHLLRRLGTKFRPSRDQVGMGFPLRKPQGQIKPLLESGLKGGTSPVLEPKVKGNTAL